MGREFGKDIRYGYKVTCSREINKRSRIGVIVAEK